jgi:hypothetical protein
MVVAPVVRGLLGIETFDAGRMLRIAPALPATWDRIEARNVSSGAARYDLTFERTPGRAALRAISRTPSAEQARLVVIPAFPLDAHVHRVTVNGRQSRFEATRVGDEQRVGVIVNDAERATEVVYFVDDGTDVEADPVPPLTGAANQGLKLLRVEPDATTLHMVVEGLGRRAYVARVRSPHRVSAADGVAVLQGEGRDQRIEIRFEGTPNEFVRRELRLKLVNR